MDERFEIVAENNDFSKIAIIGDVDIQTSKYLQDFFESAISRCSSNIVIDCEELTYIDSCGIYILIQALIKMKKKGLGIYFVKMNRSTKKLFKITHLYNGFNLVS